MKPIEHVWYLLKRRIQKPNPQPVTVPKLKVGILGEWNKLTLIDIGNVTEFMPNRIQDLLAMHGEHSKW